MPNKTNKLRTRLGSLKITLLTTPHTRQDINHTPQDTDPHLQSLQSRTNRFQPFHSDVNCLINRPQTLVLNPHIGEGLLQLAEFVDASYCLSHGLHPSLWPADKGLEHLEGKSRGS